MMTDNEENIDKIQKVSEKIKNKTEKFIDEQKTKISQIELPKPIKEAAENIIEEHNIRKEKFMETINNSIPSGLTKLFETTLSQVSVKSLQSALKVLTRENNIVNQPLYIAQINEYIKENA